MATWLPYGVGPREDEIKGPTRERRIGETRGRSGYDSFSPGEFYKWLGDLEKDGIRLSVPARVEKVDGKWSAVRIKKPPCTVIPMPAMQRPTPQQTQGDAFQRPRKTAP